MLFIDQDVMYLGDAQCSSCVSSLNLVSRSVGVVKSLPIKSLGLPIVSDASSVLWTTAGQPVETATFFLGPPSYFITTGGYSLHLCWMMFFFSFFYIFDSWCLSHLDLPFLAAPLFQGVYNATISISLGWVPLYTLPRCVPLCPSPHTACLVDPCLTCTNL